MIIFSQVFSQSDKELNKIALKYGVRVKTDDFDGSKTLYFDRTPISLFVRKTQDSVSLVWRLGYETNKASMGMKSAIILAGGKTFNIEFDEKDIRILSGFRRMGEKMTAIMQESERELIYGRLVVYANYVDYDISRDEDMINAILESKSIKIRYAYETGEIDEKNGRADIKGMKAIISLYKELSIQ